jgi:hypothetical protein
MRRSGGVVGLRVNRVDGSIHSIVGSEVSMCGPFERNICLLPSFIPSIIFLDTFAASPSESETGPRDVSFWPQELHRFGIIAPPKKFPWFSRCTALIGLFFVCRALLFPTTITYYPFTTFDDDGVYCLLDEASLRVLAASHGTFFIL